MRQPINKIFYNKGDKIGECIYLNDSKSINWQRYAMFLCRCGNIFEAQIQKVKSGHTNSCGCYQKQRISETKTIHGQSCGSKPTSEYSTWVNIQQRCYNKKNKSYERYGGRGITISDEWLASFDNFYNDMGPKPSPSHSLERLDNLKGYFKQNCIWATTKEQCNNRRSNINIEYQGQIKTLKQWCEELNLDYQKIIQRIKILKWSPTEAFEGKKNKKTWRQSM